MCNYCIVFLDTGHISTFYQVHSSLSNHLEWPTVTNIIFTTVKSTNIIAILLTEAIHVNMWGTTDCQYRWVFFSCNQEAMVTSCGYLVWLSVSFPPILQWEPKVWLSLQSCFVGIFLIVVKILWLSIPKATHTFELVVIIIFKSPRLWPHHAVLNRSSWNMLRFMQVSTTRFDLS